MTPSPMSPEPQNVPQFPWGYSKYCHLVVEIKPVKEAKSLQQPPSCFGGTGHHISVAVISHYVSFLSVKAVGFLLTHH